MKSNNTRFDELSHLKKQLAHNEKKIAELQLGNLFLNALMDSINEEIMLVDEDHVIKEVNIAFMSRYGLKKDDIIGRKCYEVKALSGSPCHAQDDSCPLNIAKKTRDRVEMAYSQRDEMGSEKEINLTMYPLKSENGEIRYYFEIARDVTDYKGLIRRLQASEKRFRAILDTATDAILSIDEDNRIILFNNAAERIFGYNRGEILGKSLNMLIPSHYGDHHRFIQRYLRDRTSEIIGKTISLSALRKNGEEFPVELGLSFLDMGGTVTFTSLIRDVSEQRRLEKKLLQTERLAAVGHSVAYVAHELKNPLMIIGGFSSQIRKSLMDEKDLNKLDMILDEVRRLEHLVAELGDFTRALKLVKRSADINSVMKDVVKIMTAVYSADLFGFNESLSDEIGEIECDPDKLKQVFINIISNGFEAMDDGGFITIITEKAPSGIYIRISDEGPGIPELDLQHIFEPFYTTREKGSGLGLPISYRIIQAHDGDISAISRPGEGTTFIIWLPSK